MKISVQELLIVLAILVILFGPTQIPRLKKAFRKSASEIKATMKSDEK